MSAVTYERAETWSHGFAFVPAFDAQMGWHAAVKRLLDLLVAIAALALLIVPMLLIAVLIKLDSRGPVLLGQVRIGRDLEPFRMYKFRSMVANAAAMQTALAELNEASGPLFKMKRDPRLTRVGRLLRRTSLDETPQLFNVIKGEMSLVGPRPPLGHEVAHDRGRQALRLRAIPGMTGAWQVSGRSDLSYEQMIALDLDYLDGWTIGRDLKILLKTPDAVLTGKGAR